MSQTIEYYFTTMSPFTWLGHNAFAKVAEKHGKTIQYKPFNLMGVWEISGAVPPGARPPVRQRYRLIELQRIAEFHGLSINIKPTNFPTDPSLADHCVIAISNAGGDATSFVHMVGEALWSHDRQIADEAVIGELLSACGHDAKAIIAASKADAIAETRKANTQEAIDYDAVGAPAYVYKGEVFWGQDRVDYLDHMITSGREPYSA